MSKTETAPKTIRLIGIQADNFMRLKAVKIRVGRRITTLNGRNGQGKTSILHAIAAALGGKAQIPERPIRKGAKTAQIILETDLYTVTRKFSESGSQVYVEAKKGSALNRPQELLDRVFNDLSFDPMAFTRMKPAQQVEVLLDVAGLRGRFDAWQKQRAEIEATRLEIGREAKRYGAEASAGLREAPEQIVSVADLAEQIKAAHERNRKNAEDRAALQRARDALSKLQAELAALEQQQKTIQDRIAKGWEWCKANEETIEAAQDVPVEQIEQEIRDAEMVNDSVRHNLRIQEALEKKNELDEQYQECTDSLAAIEAEKTAALEAARLPIDGLSFGEHGLLWNGVEFDQASMAEQIRVSVAMGLAQNPELRLMLVRDGSLLDDDSLAELERILEEQNAQAIVERVGSEVEGCGVVIEDGEVVEESPAE